MSGEIKLFRRELFGGFARRDVIEYIRKLADERNRYLGAQKAAEDEIEILGATLDTLKAELAESNRLLREVRVDALTDAQTALSALGSAYEDVRSDVEATATHIRGELLKAADTVSLMTQILDRAGQRFCELRGIVEREKSAADSDLAEITSAQDSGTVLSELKLLPRKPLPDGARGTETE